MAARACNVDASAPIVIRVLEASREVTAEAAARAAWREREKCEARALRFQVVQPEKREGE
jgi:hypothetical protein